MVGRNYTSAFRYERRLYGVFDLQLPRPATFGQVGVWAGMLVVMLLAAGAGLLPWGTESLWLYVAVPVGAAWAVGQPGPDRRPLHRWAAAQVRFWLRPSTLDGLREKTHPAELEVVGDVFRPDVRRPGVGGGRGG